MWTEQFKNFREFIDEFRDLFLFNTLKENGSLTCYDLQKFGNINPSKTYRKMKALEQSGLLKSSSEESSTGRPKKKYFITEQGEKRAIEIRQDVEKYFKFLKENSIIETDFNIPSFLDKTFNLWTEPVERIINSDISISGKINALSEVENDLLDLLAKVRKEKSKLKKKKKIEKVT